MKRFYHMPHFIIGIFLSLWMITPAWAQDKPNILTSVRIPKGLWDTGRQISIGLPMKA
jgi:hypothetical protein